MCDSRAVPSGKVYRQVFDAQVQLSRSLLAGRKETRTDLSAEDSNTHSSTTRERTLDDGEDQLDVSRLPDTVVVGCSNSDIIKQLTEKRNKKHEETLKQLSKELTRLSQVCESQVRTVSLELLSSMQEVDLRLDNLKDRMEQMKHQDQQLHGWFGLWRQAEEEMTLKKTRIMELKHKLTESEHQRTSKIRVVLRKYCHLLEKISFLLPQDVHRLIHTEATMLNQTLLANRRSTARLLLLLREQNLQQESVLRLHWDDCLNRWRRSRVTEVIDGFRCLFSSDEEPLVLVQQPMSERWQVLTEQRRDLVSKISSLVPPTCSTDLVSDWFNQLTDINQQIDSFHASLLLQLRRCSEQKWQDRLAQVDRCQEELSALQLPEEEVNDVISSELLTLIGRSQRQAEEELAALDVCCDSVASHALSLSRCAFAVMRGAALLWETHSHRLQRREEALQQHVDDLHQAQQQGLKKKKVQLENMLVGLRQESSEETLKKFLEKTTFHMQDVSHSYRQCVSDQCEVLDRLPAVFLEELLSYSSNLSIFYRLDHTYIPDEHELVGSSVQHSQTVSAEPTQPAQDWLTEAESSLTDLSDISMCVTFTSSRGVTYTGPAFQCPAPDVQQKTYLSMFPVELLTHTLSRTRTLFFDHLEQHFHDILSSAVATVTEKKEAVSSQQELYLQQLDPQHIRTHIYEPRLVELQLHRQRVDTHCEEMMDVLTSCMMELQELQTFISKKAREFTVSLSNMEEDMKTARSSQHVETVSSTLKDSLDQHIKDTQCCQATFRRTLQSRLWDIRTKTALLLSSFRLFSEGGDFAPQEVKSFQRRVKDQAKEISVTEESICSKLEAFESKILQQVKEASDQLEEKLLLIKSEVKFTEEIQKIMSNTQVNIKTEVASSTQQQLAISSSLEELMKMLEKPQASPDQVLCFLSSLLEELRTRCGYLDVKLEDFTLSAHPEPQKLVRSVPPAALLLPSRTGEDLREDPVVGVIRSLNRVCVVQLCPTDGAETGAGPVQHLHHKPTDAVSALRCCRSIRTDRRFQIFGPTAEPETRSYCSAVNSVLWKANDVLLLVAEDFYRCERLNRFQLVPDSLDQWAESLQQRLLGYQEQAQRFLSTSRRELVAQLSALDELLHLLPSVLINNHEQQQEAVLTEEVAEIRRTLEELLQASEKDKGVIVRQLRASLQEDELQALNRREERRQQQLHSAICCSHMEIQERARARGEEFVMSLASLTEKVLYYLDNTVTPAETDAALIQQQSEDSVVSMETTTESGQKHWTVNTTWSGITLLVPRDPSPSVTTITTASITTARCTMGHRAAIEQRDAAVKRVEQLISSVVSRSDYDKRRRLSELQSWKKHWRQQTHAVKHSIDP